jgi:hypothetical protein
MDFTFPFLDSVLQEQNPTQFVQHHHPPEEPTQPDEAGKRNGKI